MCVCIQELSVQVEMINGFTNWCIMELPTRWRGLHSYCSRLHVQCAVRGWSIVCCDISVAIHYDVRDNTLLISGATLLHIIHTRPYSLKDMWTFLDRTVF